MFADLIPLAAAAPGRRGHGRRRRRAAGDHRPPQQVVVVVNGEPITALDIEQRTKLMQLSTPEGAARQEVLEELIDEKLKVREGKRFGIEVTDAGSRQRLRLDGEPHAADAEQLTQALAKAGISASTLKSRIRADIVWQQLVRGRYQASLQIGDKDILTALEAKPEGRKRRLSTTPCGRSCSSCRPARRRRSSRRASARPKRCARRFKSCEEGIAFARALQGRRGARPGQSAARPTFRRSCARCSTASRSAS